MVVYIEYAIAENFFIDYTLLFLALKTLKLKKSRLRICLSSCVGTAFAVAFPLFKIPSAPSYILKISIGILMCLITVSREKPIKHILFTGIFFAYTFCLGGSITALYSFFDIEYDINGGYVIASVPAFTVVFFTVAFFVFASFLIKKIYSSKKIGEYVCDCVIKRGGVSVSVKGYLDSGNSFEYGGVPVSIISVSLALKLIGRKEDFSALISTSVSTVNGDGKIILFPVDEIEIYSGEKINKIKCAYLGISRNLKSAEYSIILNREYITGGGHERS